MPGSHPYHGNCCGICKGNVSWQLDHIYFRHPSVLGISSPERAGLKSPDLSVLAVILASGCALVTHPTGKVRMNCNSVSHLYVYDIFTYLLNCSCRITSRNVRKRYLDRMAPNSPKIVVVI